MSIKTFPTASLSVIKFYQWMKPAALLTEALVSTCNGDFGSLWMHLTNFMPAMILSAFTEVCITPINQAMSYIPWCLGPLWWRWWWWWFHHTIQFLPLNSWPELTTTSQNVKESYNLAFSLRQDLNHLIFMLIHPPSYSKIFITSNPIKQNRNI